MKTSLLSIFSFFMVLICAHENCVGQINSKPTYIKENVDVFAVANQKPKIDKIYETHLLEHGATILVGGALTYYGLRHQNKEGDIAVSEVFSLNKNSLNSFDKKTINQDVTKLESSRILSDQYLGLSLGLVPLLVIDKKVRKEWSSILVLYFESLAITGAVQTWTAIGTNRYRPITYMNGVDTGRRIDRRNVNSFYSGHTAEAATASFFAAKIYSDLHPEIGNKKWLLYTAALIPPYLVGSNRIKAGKHFYSDVLMGGLMGAAAGVIIPQIHKRKKRKNSSFLPKISPNSIGLNYSLIF